ncbi:MAG: transporter [Pseudomonadales bacterium]|nr:transporter [Pseudomonadales bacterium]
MRTSSIAINLALMLYCVPALPDTRPDSHAPISIMGDHLHQKGELMLSYRFMHMDMQGNRTGTSHISPEHIATSTTNPFANLPMQPQTLRVVPTKMTMDMHMFGLMYAPSDRLTVMAMLNYLEKEMQHLTFMGSSGSTSLGTFTTKTSGLGDSSLSALIKLNKSEHTQSHITVGISLPTGEIKETDNILTPMNTRPSPRLPYPMQLGSGSFGAIVGTTYSGNINRWGWGGQWRSVFRLNKNDEDYRLGNEHRLSGWGSYLMNPHINLSGRLSYYRRDNIHGIDSQIRAPVQTADPDRQAKKVLELGLGMNFLLPGNRNRLAVELGIPLYRDLDGPQLETDWTLTLGWQFTPG